MNKSWKPNVALLFFCSSALMAQTKQLPLNPIIELLFADDVQASAAVLFKDEFDSDTGWSLITDDIWPDPMSNDSALAEISGGKLRMEANQDFGGPTASAKREISLNKAINNLTLKLDIDSHDHSSFSEATAEIRISSNAHLVTYQLGCATTLFERSMGTPSHVLTDFTIALTVRGDEVTSKVNDFTIDAEPFNDCYVVSELAVPSPDLVGLELFLEATDPNAFFSVDLVVDSLELLSF